MLYADDVVTLTLVTLVLIQQVDCARIYYGAYVICL